jgi:hypothetical protein
MMVAEKIEDALRQYYCTEQYWKNDMLCFQYTDGVKAMWTMCEAYWLLIAISSYRRKESFQIWELKKTGPSSAVLTMKEDSDEPVLVRQKIGYTDFPLDKIKLYLIDGVLILPSEY